MQPRVLQLDYVVMTHRLNSKLESQPLTPPAHVRRNMVESNITYTTLHKPMLTDILPYHHTMEGQLIVYPQCYLQI